MYRNERENYISSLMHAVDAMDFDLSRKIGLDLAMMKCIVDHHYWFVIKFSDMYKDNILIINGKRWASFSSDYIIKCIHLWEKEKAIYLFNSLVRENLISCNGSISDEPVLICCE